MSQQLPQGSRDGGEGSGSNKGWLAVSYLISGMAFWGFIGWAIDRWWLHTGGIATAIGIVAGMAGGVYLVVRRMGS